VVTFLFADIEGSTGRWESDADAMRSALGAHGKVLRTAIEVHDGFLFSHTGDVEHFEWLEPLFNERLDIRDGRMYVPARLGLGFSLSEQARAWTTHSHTAH
jgi:class 3 adenylate cyclase